MTRTPRAPFSLLTGTPNGNAAFHGKYGSGSPKSQLFVNRRMVKGTLLISLQIGVYGVWGIFKSQTETRDHEPVVSPIIGPRNGRANSTDLAKSLTHPAIRQAEFGNTQ